MAADAIVIDSGAMHIAGVPIVNPSTVVIWEVTPSPGNGFQTIPKTSVGSGVPPSLNPPSWDGFSLLDVSNFSAYVSLEAATQSAVTTTWGSRVTAVAFDPTRGGSVITIVIVFLSGSTYRT